MICRSYEHLDGTILVLLYKALNRPRLEYGDVVLSPHLIKEEYTLTGEGTEDGGEDGPMLAVTGL